MSYYSYTDLEKIIGCEKLNKKTKGEVFVVMGFQRSGTSLLANIVNTCGVFFGKKSELKKPLITNPDGFFEHEEISNLSWEYLKEAGYHDNINYDVNLHPKNLWRRIKRLVTVKNMHNVLYDLSFGQEKWGIKNFPIFYYLWKDYLPKHKIIAIYRNPYVSTHSFLNIFWPSKFTYEYGLLLWTQAQKDLIYHISQTDSILIQYEDLIDDNKNSSIIQKLIEFIGADNPEDIKKIIKTSLNRKTKEVSFLVENYPLHKDTIEILKILDKIKIQTH